MTATSTACTRAGIGNDPLDLALRHSDRLFLAGRRNKALAAYEAVRVLIADFFDRHHAPIRRGGAR
jgi:hypothetical protein